MRGPDVQAPVRVAHVIPGLQVGGAETALYKLLSREHRSKVASTVICLGDRGEIGAAIEAAGVPVRYLGMGAGAMSMVKMGKLIALLRGLRPEVIQGWMYHGNLVATLSSSLLPQRPAVLWNVRGPGTDLSRRVGRRLVYWLTGRLSRTPTKIVNNSSASMRMHERLLRYPADRWVFIPNGFDMDTFKPDDNAPAAVRALLNIPSSAPLIGLVARYDPMKDHANFLTAAAELIRDGRNVHFVLIGGGVDEDNGDLVRMIGSCGLEGRVHLLGTRRDVCSLMPGFDIGSLCSYGEGFPNVVGEWMSCGVPCVVTDVGESAAIVGDTGRIVPPRDSRALAQAWRSLLDIPAEARRTLGRTARRRIEDRYSLETVTLQYERLYRQTVLQCAA